MRSIHLGIIVVSHSNDNLRAAELRDRDHVVSRLRCARAARARRHDRLSSGAATEGSLPRCCADHTKVQGGRWSSSPEGSRM